MKSSTVVTLANTRESYELYVNGILDSWRATGFTLHPRDFFKDLDMPDGDFSYEQPELSESYPTKDGRKYRLTSSVVSYGRKNGKYWIQIKETDPEGELKNSIFWNQAREPMDDESKPLHPIVTRIWSHLSNNGEFEKWIMYWFDMIDQSDEENEIIDEANVLNEVVQADVKESMSVDDWVLFCLREIKENMLLLNKSWEKVTD